MIKEWIENLVFTASNDDVDSRRKSPRRSSDSAVATIDGKTYAIENWSEGGMLLSGDDKMFGVDQPLDATVKFKLTNKMVELQQTGKIVRKNANKVAVQFGPITSGARRKFKQVIEDAITREFVESQIA